MSDIEEEIQKALDNISDEVVERAKQIPIRRDVSDEFYHSGQGVPGSVFGAYKNRFEEFESEEREVIAEALRASDDVDFDVRRRLLKELEDAGEGED